MIKILHILNRISGDGPTRSLIETVKIHKRLGLNNEHAVLSFEKEAYPKAMIDAISAGIKLHRNPSIEKWKNLISEADIVEIHFWNNPKIYQYLKKCWPTHRCLIHYHILGQYLPQIITAPVVSMGDFHVVTSKESLSNLQLVKNRNKRSILALSDFSRLNYTGKKYHKGFNVVYIGTVNYAKLNPNFVKLCESIEVNDISFKVCGNADQQVVDDIKKSKYRRNFQLMGYIEELDEVLSTCDVFGYPLNRNSYATSEKSVQEAMFFGLPVVAFNHPGTKHLIKHRVNGLLVNTESEYIEAIHYLHKNPAIRLLLGKRARETALQDFNPEKAAIEVHEIYQHMLLAPKNKRSWRGTSLFDAGSDQFLESLGNAGHIFDISRNSQDLGLVAEADNQILEGDTMLSGGEGGIIHYRNNYPDDPWLLYWSALAQLGQKRLEAAENDFCLAIKNGFNILRIQRIKEKFGFNNSQDI